ncbi:MAG: hypothetical protein KA149_10850 [Chitinophagales bacterium]|nr:hypothetical protein [Chitinophagales bacterium]
MINSNWYNIRGIIVLLVCGVITFLVLPYSLYKSYSDNKNLENRLKITEGKVIRVSGLKSDITLIEFYIDNRRFERTLSAPSIHKKHVGDDIKVMYDSLDFENIQAIW